MKIGHARALDAKAYEKFHRVFVSYLHQSSLFLVGENKTCFSKELLSRFIMSTLTEYHESSLKGETNKVIFTWLLMNASR